jgi:hypothetical protein
MVRVSKRDWPALAKKLNIVDPVLVQDEAERKRKIELEIIMAVGAVEDRQNQEYWRKVNQEREEEKKKQEEIAKQKAEKKQKRKEKISALISGAISGAKNKPRASSPARRSTGNKSPAEKRSKPIRFEDREFEMPDFNPPWSR